MTEIQHTCSGAGRMSCKVWKSYFQFSHKGNTLLHILMDSEHVADWRRIGFVSLGMHFIVLHLAIQGTVRRLHSLTLIVFGFEWLPGKLGVGDIFF